MVKFCFEILIMRMENTVAKMNEYLIQMTLDKVSQSSF